MKKCSKCLESKSFTEFSKSKGSKFGLFCYCKPCSSLVAKEYRMSEKVKNDIKKSYEKRKILANEKNREYYKNRTPETKALRATKQMNSHLRLKYGISVEQYNEMLDSQNGCCLICNKNQNTLNRRLAVDHCHKTGKVRGLLCAACNTSLGHLEEDIDRMTRLINYVELHNEKK